jgi:two-component sensor histidine kinase
LALEELSPYCQQDGSRAHIEGPQLMLEQGPAQAVALTLHELASNAAKYGALSTPSGRIAIEWRLQSAARLFVRWSEAGGPTVTAPTRQGFGTRVMERVICSQHNGELRYDWRPQGVVCEIVLQI